MNNKLSRIGLVLTLIAVLAAGLALGVSPAKAADGTFHISVYHGINGAALGLSKELPVVASVYKDGAWLANIPLEFKDRFSADLPAGTYTIMVTSAEAGPLPSMTLSNVAIPEGVDVRIQAQLSAGKTPILNARVK